MSSNIMLFMLNEYLKINKFSMKNYRFFYLKLIKRLNFNIAVANFSKIFVRSLKGHTEKLSLELISSFLH